MSRIKGKTHTGSAPDIIKKVYDDLNGKVSIKDIEMVIARFWGKDHFIKYLKGFKSFSIKRLFFFVVHKDKFSIYWNNKMKVRNRHNSKSNRKLKHQAKLVRQKKKKEIDLQIKEKTAARRHIIRVRRKLMVAKEKYEKSLR
jgi:hypothetical protein